MENEDAIAIGRAKARVTLAQDVLDQLAGGVIQATLGEYVGLDQNVTMLWKLSTVNSSYDLRELVTVSTECRVCAKGALFVAKVSRFNAISTSQVPGPTHWRSMAAYLSEFPRDQLDLMEFAFEGRITGDPDVDGEMLHVAQKWRRDVLNRFDSHADQLDEGVIGPVLLRAIMQNVVDNGGEFVP